MSLDDFKDDDTEDTGPDIENKQQNKEAKCRLIGVRPSESDICKSGRCYYHQVGHHLCLLVQRGIEPEPMQEYYKPGNTLKQLKNELNNEE